MKNRNLYLYKKMRYDTKTVLKKFSSFMFDSFFDDEKIIDVARKVFEYETPIYCAKPHNLSDVTYQKWLYDMFIYLSLSNHLILLLDGAKLWCNVEVISYNDFSREMIELNPNKDFTIIDANKKIVFDFSCGETDYEIRVLNCKT